MVSSRMLVAATAANINLNEHIFHSPDIRKTISIYIN